MPPHAPALQPPVVPFTPLPAPARPAPDAIVALARAAMANGQAALAAGDHPAAQAWLDRAGRLVPGDPNVTLSLASLCLGPDPARAERLFGSVLQRWDVRQAWIGLAAARLRQGQPAEASAALAMALSRHALASDSEALAAAISQAAGEAAWCGLTSSGRVTVNRVAIGAAEPDRIEIRLDGKPVRGAALPRGWPSRCRVDVLVGGRPALGSPIRPGAIRRVAGCVEARDGAIHGWAWYPGDPATPVALSVQCPSFGHTRTIVADAETIEVPHTGPLARPRSFSVPRRQLRGHSGPVHVRGLDGIDLPGSPLDPADVSAWGLSTVAPLPTHPTRVGAVAPGVRPRRIAVVIPVHDAGQLAIACLTSVLASVPASARVIVVDDGSREPALLAALDGLSRRHEIRLLRHPRPLGFPASANAGIIAAARRDVVLLNSDTLLPPGWLGRLRAAAYSASDIGSVTPFSNDASIVSYPGEAGTNPRPDQAETNRLDRLASRANGEAVVEIPVGVGFCLYLRRDCLGAVGLLRADVFAQGYGEENDFCLRAHRLGWRHVALTGLFVGHHGGGTFGPRASHLRARNARLLERLHPGYDLLIQRFTDRDPLANARRRIDLLRWRAAARPRQPSVILVTHADGGGVEQRVEAAVRAHAAGGRRPIILRPARPANGDRAIAVHDGLTDAVPNLVYQLPRERAALLRLLRATHPSTVEVHHLLGHPQPEIGQLITGLEIPYDVQVHDYAWFCPRVSLVGARDRYCGEPDLAGCEACVASLGHHLNEDITVAALTARSAAFLAGARHVCVPSDDAGQRIARHFPAVRPVTLPHHDDGPHPPAVHGRHPVTAKQRLRVCVVGGIGVHKGYDVLLGCARDAARRNLPLEFVVVGTTIDDAALLATGRAFVTGGYQPREAVGLIQAQHAGLGFVPSIWPETWCLALGELWHAGLAAAAFDIGAPAERIRRSGQGFLLPLGLSSASINSALVASRGIASHN